MSNAEERNDSRNNGKKGRLVFHEEIEAADGEGVVINDEL